MAITNAIVAVLLEGLSSTTLAFDGEGFFVAVLAADLLGSDFEIAAFLVSALSFSVAEALVVHVPGESVAASFFSVSLLSDSLF